MTRKQSKKPTNKSANKAEKPRRRQQSNGKPAAVGAMTRHREPSTKNPIVRGVYNQINRDVKNSVLPNMRGSVGSNINRGERPGPEMFLRPAYADYVRSLAKPFDTQGIRAVVNYNPVPSLVTSTARMVCTQGLAVGAGLSGGFIVSPGHGGVVNNGSNTPAMDGPSYHSQCQNVGSIPTVMTVGPMDLPGNVGIMGLTYSGTPLWQLPNGSNSALVSGLAPQVKLPYITQLSSGAHSRWKLVSAGIRITCTTVENSRSSTMITVQPNQRGFNLNNVDVRLLSINPSFRLSTGAFEGTEEISWLPRLEDCAFWHTASITAQNSFEWAGLIVHIPNDTASTQTYVAEIVQNYELAGEYLLAVGDESIHLPAEKSNFEPALNVLRLGSSSAKGLPEVAASVAASAIGHPRMRELASAAAGHLGAAAVKGLIGLMG